ncbi:MAG TPA: universal stress protein [Polyangiaceae bacterium]
MTSSSKPFVIVVGVDHSEISRAALRQAFQLAADHRQGEVHVLHVQTALVPYPYLFPKLQATVAQAIEHALQRLKRVVADELATFQETLRRLGCRPFGHVVSHVRSQASGREIAQLAADLGADLVVVGAHGRSSTARLLLGSVAHAVVTSAPCPVLVVRPKRLDLREPSLEPPCARCVEKRQQSGGVELWCAEHREHHGQRSSYYQVNREEQGHHNFDRN